MDIIHILRWVLETLDDNRIHNSKKRQTIQWPREQAMIYETLHIKLTIEQHENH